MRHLKRHQQELLAELVRCGGMESVDVDGRTLRPLLAAGYALTRGSRILASDQGRVLIDQQGKTNAGRSFGVRLNGKQEDLLRTVARRGRNVCADELDGRVVGALASRGLIARRDRYVTVTDAGRSYLRAPHGTSAKRQAPTPENGRVAVIMRALALLERSLPTDAEVLVGNILAGADDVVDGFRKYARGLSRPKKKGE